MANDTSTFTQEYGYLIDQFDELQDLRYSDLLYLDEYKTLKMRKNDGETINQARLDELEPLFQNKIVTSARWNKFQNALLGMQTFIKNEVQDYVATKQNEMQTFVNTKKTEVNGYVDNKKLDLDTEINKFQYRGTYNASTQYYQRNLIDYNDGTGVNTYLCIQDSINNLPINTNYFKKLTIKGSQGLAGVGLKFVGEWNSSNTYAKDDCVQYGGYLFASLVSSNFNNNPNLTMDTTYWGRVLSATVTVSELSGWRNITTQTSNINFITGEITAFNPNIDNIEVYQDGLRITKGVDYKIGVDNQSIDNLKGTWDATSENPIFFEFIITKNIKNELVFSDGSAITIGTITKDKLTTDVQNQLDKVDEIAGEGRTNETIKGNANIIGNHIDNESVHFTEAERLKLSKIDDEANNYVHPEGTNPHGTTANDVNLGNVDNVKQMPIAGGTFTGIVKAQTNTSYTVAQLRNVILSTLVADVNSMNDGDIWIKYE